MKVSELIQMMGDLCKEAGQDLEVAMVYEMDGFFAFDMFIDADVFQYPIDDQKPLTNLRTVLAIKNRYLGSDQHAEDSAEVDKKHLRIVKPEENEPT